MQPRLRAGAARGIGGDRHAALVDGAGAAEAGAAGRQELDLRRQDHAVGRRGQALQLADRAHLRRAHVDRQQRLRGEQIGVPHFVDVHRQAEAGQQVGQQERPLADAEAARDHQPARVVASRLPAGDELPDLLVGVAHRRGGGLALAGKEFVDRAAAAERERGELGAGRVAAGQRGAVAHRGLVAAGGAMALDDPALEARRQQPLRLDRHRAVESAAGQRADQAEAGAVAGVRRHQRMDAAAGERGQSVRHRQRQRVRQHRLPVQQHDAVGGQVELRPQRARHVFDDRPVSGGDDLLARHALRLQLARVFHQQHGAGGVDLRRARGLHRLGAGRRRAGDAEHRRQRIHQAAGAGRALQVHRVAEQLGLRQRQRRHLGVLAADVDQDAHVVAHAADAGDAQSRQMLAGAVDRAARMGVVLDQHRHPPGELRVDALERLLDLVARRAGHADAAHAQHVAARLAQRGEGALHGLHRVAGVAVGGQVNEGAAVGVGGGDLGHRRADVQADQQRLPGQRGRRRLVGQAQVAPPRVQVAAQLGQRRILGRRAAPLKKRLRLADRRRAGAGDQLVQRLEHRVAFGVDVDLGHAQRGEEIGGAVARVAPAEDATREDDFGEAGRQPAAGFQHFRLQRHRQRGGQRDALVLVGDRRRGGEHAAAVGAHRHRGAPGRAVFAQVRREQAIDVLARQAELLQHAIEVDARAGTAARIDGEQVVLQRAAGLDAEHQIAGSRQLDQRQRLGARRARQPPRRQPGRRRRHDRLAVAERAAHHRRQLAGQVKRRRFAGAVQRGEFRGHRGGQIAVGVDHPVGGDAAVAVAPLQPRAGDAGVDVNAPGLGQIHRRGLQPAGGGRIDDSAGGGLPMKVPFDRRSWAVSLIFRFLAQAACPPRPRSACRARRPSGSIGIDPRSRNAITRGTDRESTYPCAPGLPDASG
jgi:hypothetical protein